MMVVPTKNSRETTRNYRKQQYCVGMQKHQNHNHTGSRRKFGKIQSIYTTEKKLKIWDDEMKLIVQQKNLAYKRYLQAKTIDNENK
jgi:hypothetical protein